MRLIYTFLLAIVSPFLLVILFRHKKGKPNIGQRWKEYFGFIAPLKNKNPIWIHAVSVGEIIAAKPIIFSLRDKYPNQSILVTTTTTTGAAIAEQLGEGIEHRYMPIDFPFAIKSFLKCCQPKIMLIMETELWPNTLTLVKKAQVPIIVLNARLSERSMNRYQKIQPFFKHICDNISLVLCQFNEDANRFKQLGLAEQKIQISGSVKFDLPFFDTSCYQVTELKNQLNHRPVWIAASTHEGEDEILLNAHQKILQQIPEALLILVPRHPERFLPVAMRISTKKLTLVKRSQKNNISSKTQVYLGDTMGEMMTLFAVADLCFMAGSLIGKKVGGHNLLEPASLGKPILMGPSFYNFEKIATQLIEEGACQICHDENEIAHCLIDLFNDRQKQHLASQAAINVVEKNRGAVVKTLSYLQPWI